MEPLPPPLPTSPATVGVQASGDEADELLNQVANMNLNGQSFDNHQINSPNDMVVDTDDYPAEPEKDDVAIITPDNLDVETEQLESLPLANDRAYRPGPPCTGAPCSRCAAGHCPPLSMTRADADFSCRRGYERYCLSAFNRGASCVGRPSIHLDRRELAESF